VQIIDGRVVNAGGSEAAVRGRVAPGGAISVTVQAGGQWAGGSGHLTATRGGGVWRGQGSRGACEGTWVAQRTGLGSQAQAGAPAVTGMPPAVARSRAAAGSNASCAARFRSYDPETGS
jgi:hypothetical protein